VYTEVGCSGVELHWWCMTFALMYYTLYCACIQM